MLKQSAKIVEDTVERGISVFAILPRMFEHASPCYKSLSRCSPRAKLFRGHFQAQGAAKTMNNLTGAYV